MNSSANFTIVSSFSDDNTSPSPAYETQIENMAEENEEFNDISLISTSSRGTPVSDNTQVSIQNFDSQSDIFQFENVNKTSPVIATPTRADLDNDIQNYILNYSTPESIDLDLTSLSSDMSTMGNETVESELGPDSENALDILKKIRIKNLNIFF